MSADIWNGNGNWSNNISDWSLGVQPGSSDDAIIQSGTDTLTTTGLADVLTVISNAALDIESGGSLTAKGIKNSGSINYATDGAGGSFTLSGAFSNTGYFTIGTNNEANSATATVGSLADSGTVTLWGNQTLGTTIQTTLDVLSAAPSTLTGSIFLHGDADLEYKSGGIKTIAAGAEIQIDGQQSRISSNGTTGNTALSGLSTIAGTFDLEGDWSTGPGGTSVTTTGGVFNSGNLQLDVYGGDGASKMTIKGALTNTGTVTLGNSSLTANSTLDVENLTDMGTIVLWGDEKLGTTKQATLDDTGAGPGTLVGNIFLHGDSDLAFASVGITGIASGDELQIDGKQSRVSLGLGNGNSGLTGFTNNAGTFDLEGNWSTGPGGTTVNTTVGLVNSGNLDIDVYGEDGASQMSIGGTLTNTGTVTIGNSGLSTPSKLQVQNLVNTGTIVLWGDEKLGTTEQATFDDTGAAPTTLTGKVFLHGDADLEFGSGGITAIAAGAEFQLDGQQSRASIGSGKTNSALSGLASNYGTLDLEGNWSTGPGGASITTSAAFTNADDLYLDVYGGDGASSFTVNSTFTNTKNVEIGSSTLSANSTLTVDELVNTGYIYLQGSTATGASEPQAILDVKSAAPTTSSGYLRSGANGVFEFASGGIQTIGAGSTIELDGAASSFQSGSGGQYSALSTLTTVDGELLLRGNTGSGSGGVDLTLNSGLINAGTVAVDTINGDDGSELTIKGAITNSDAFEVGNTSIGASTTVTATSLKNTGAVTVQGNSGATGTALATLAITGAATAAVTNSYRIGGSGVLSFGSGNGLTSTVIGGSIELDGARADVTIAGGAQNSGLANFATNAGTLLLRGSSGYGEGGVTLTTSKALNNTGFVEVDYYGNDGGSDFTITGALTNSGTMSIGNGSLFANTVVNAKSLANTGSLTVQGGDSGAGSKNATLAISGAAAGAVTNFIRVGGDATLSFGSGSGLTSISAGGWLELDGSQASVQVGSHGQNSGLDNLASNAGTLLLRGASGFGTGGVTLATGVAFTNSGDAYFDYYGNDGGSDVTFGGALTNTGTIVIGNTSQLANTSVSASSLVDAGSLTVQGSTGPSSAPHSTLDVSGAESLTVSSFTRIGGDATLEFGSGAGFTGIVNGGWLEIDGANADVEIGATGGNSGLSNLSSNGGTLLIRGDSGFGQGGVSFSTSAAFTNTGLADIDSYGNDGGSDVAFSGLLTNESDLNIGNYGLSASTTVSDATGLSNLSGEITLEGSGYTATLAITGGVTNDASIYIGTGSLLSASGVYTQYTGTTTINGDLSAKSYVQDGGTTTINGVLEFKNVSDLGGTMTFNSQLTSSSTVTSIALGDDAILSFTSGVSSTQSVTFDDPTDTIDLSSPGTFLGVLHGFADGDTIDLVNQTATSLSYSGGVLDVFNGGAQIAALSFSGSYSTSSFELASDNNGGTLILDPRSSKG